jgi:hypothetical protein
MLALWISPATAPDGHVLWQAPQALQRAGSIQGVLPRRMAERLHVARHEPQPVQRLVSTWASALRIAP